MDRVPYFDPDLRGRIERGAAGPVLSRWFESSVPGVYFVGLAAAMSFGPAERFVLGSDFAARRVSKHVARAPVLRPGPVVAADGGSEPRSSPRGDMTAVGSPPIGTASARGLVRAYSSYIGGCLIVLGSIAVLAHVLAPEDFGLVALAIIVTVLLYTLSDLGLSQALVVEKEVRWSVGVGVGAALSLATAPLNPLAARFFHEPELVGILSVLGLNVRRVRASTA